MPALNHVKRRLTDMSLHYPWEFNSVGRRFFPKKPTEYLTDQFTTINKANLLALHELTPLGDDDTPPEIQIKYDADTSFNCQVYGVAHPGKWITAENSDPALDYEEERSIQLTLSLRLRLEYLMVVQRLRNTSIMTYDTLTAAQRFDSYTSPESLPIKTVQIISDNIGYANNGRKPNTGVMTTHVLRAIAASEEFKDYVKFTQIQDADKLQRSLSGQLTIFEQLVGVPSGTFEISDAVYNAAAYGQTPSYKTFIGSDLVLAYVEPPGLRKWTFGTLFQWSAYNTDEMAIIAVPQYTRGTVVTEELRAFTVIDPLVTVAELGYLLKGCIDTTNPKYGGVVD